MSHEISKIDKQDGIEQAWHGLTNVQAVILLSTCWLSLWDVIKRSLYRILKDGTKEETDNCEVVCTDDEKIVIGSSVDRKTYTLFSNKSFLALVQSALDAIPGAIVASVGSVCRRARIFVTVQVPEMKTFQAAGREFKAYLNFLSSHDKSAPLIVNASTVCTVCNNTFGMNLHDESNKSLRIVVKHTSGMLAKVADVPAIIAAFYVSIQKFAEVMDKLASVPVSAVDAKAFFAGFLVDKDDEPATEIDKVELSTRRANQIDRLASLFITGKGNGGANLADVFSAITDYYTHESAGGKNDDAEMKMKQVASSEFGNSATMKAFAFAVLQDDKRIATMITTGAKVLENYRLALLAKEANA